MSAKTLDRIVLAVALIGGLSALCGSRLIAIAVAGWAWRLLGSP